MILEDKSFGAVLEKIATKKLCDRDFPGGRWLGLPISTAGGMGLDPGWGTKIPHTMQPKKKKK